MEIFHMMDVISALGLPYPSHGQSSYYVQCPCCDEGPHKKHLNINVTKDVFRCPRCGVSGGIFDLYSLYTGIPREEVYKAMLKKLRPGLVEDRKQPIIPQPVSVKEYPITYVETRHATYSALLSKLSLSKDHYQNLTKRGLSNEEITRLGYKTTPIAGLTLLAKQLRSDGLYLSGVPGFYRTENDAWTFIGEQRGILIPVRDTNGNIQGLQIRRDETQKRKFRWVSSADYKDGCRAEGWTHLSGDSHDKKIIITEGPMKADVIHCLTGLTVLAVPGVNTLTQLSKTLLRLKENGLKEVKTAFDMDFSVNLHVQNGFNNLLSLLDDMDLKYGTYIWDSRYKGLDDYVWECLMHKKR